MVSSQWFLGCNGILSRHRFSFADRFECIHETSNIRRLLFNNQPTSQREREKSKEPPLPAVPTCPCVVLPMRRATLDPLGDAQERELQSSLKSENLAWEEGWPHYQDNQPYGFQCCSSSLVSSAPAKTSNPSTENKCQRAGSERAPRSHPTAHPEDISFTQPQAPSCSSCLGVTTAEHADVRLVPALAGRDWARISSYHCVSTDFPGCRLAEHLPWCIAEKGAC